MSKIVLLMLNAYFFKQNSYNRWQSKKKRSNLLSEINLKLKDYSIFRAPKCYERLN